MLAAGLLSMARMPHVPRRQLPSGRKRACNKALDQILTEHPEVEFVQIIIYFDWNSYFIASRDCYDVIRKHGKQIVV